MIRQRLREGAAAGRGQAHQRHQGLEQLLAGDRLREVAVEAEALRLILLGSYNFV